MQINSNAQNINGRQRKCTQFVQDSDLDCVVQAKPSVRCGIYKIHRTDMDKSMFKLNINLTDS